MIDILKSQDSVDGRTTSELLTDMGHQDSAFYRMKLLKRLKHEIVAGRVEVADAIRIRIDGRPTKVPVYRLKA